MRHYKKSQLNAISRSYTASGQKKALRELESMGINFSEYCTQFGYKGSPCRLYGDIRGKSKSTLQNVQQYLSTK